MNPNKITIDEYEMNRGLKYPDEWAAAYDNALDLLDAVNAFFEELQYPYPLQVTSGFRPSEINSQTTGSSRHSLHIIGKAIDLGDADGAFKKFFQPLYNTAHSDLLRKHGLFMEHPDHTPHWVHLDIGNRVDRVSRTFVP